MATGSPTVVVSSDQQPRSLRLLAAGNSEDGELTDNVAQEAVAAPAAERRRVVDLITYYNSDGTNRDIEVILKVGSTSRIMHIETVTAGETGFFDKPIYLDATNKSLQLRLTTTPGAATEFTAHHRELS